MTKADSVAQPVQRIGVFGGSFDPIHIGHLILMEEARFQLSLDRVFFVPAADPPHKQARRMTPVEQRIEMVELAIADNEWAAMSRIDADRPGPHYTVDMLQLLQAGLGADCELYFLMGMDSLRDLPTWYQPMWLVQNCRLVALSRPDVEIDWLALEADLPGVREQVVVLDMPLIEVSSSRLRRRGQLGKPIRYQVPEQVFAFIRAQGLYRESDGDGDGGDSG